MTVFWTGGTPDLAGYGPRTMACESQNMTNSKCGKLRHMIWVSHGQEHFALPEYTGQETLLWGKQKQHIKFHANVMFIVQCMLDHQNATKLDRSLSSLDKLFLLQGTGHRRKTSVMIVLIIFKNPHTYFVSGIESGWWQQLAETKPS